MYYIGVDIGGTGIKVGVVTESGEITAKQSAPTQAGEGYEVLARDIAELISKTLNDAKITIDDVVSIGMGCPGSIDDRRGMVLYSNNINLNNAPICDEMKKYFDKPIYIGNDANCAALGEYFALGNKNIENFVAITLGTGVGGGVIINKKLFTGSNGTAGELGHIVIETDGEPCTCGRCGCWEAYASATALVRQTMEAAKKYPDSLLAKKIKAHGKASGKTSFDAMRDGDMAGREVVENYVKYVGEGVINLINIFQPDVLAIGGGISREGDNLLNPVKKYAEGRVYGADSVDKKTEITIAKLGNDAGIIGAAFLNR